MELFITYAHENMVKVRELAELLTAGGHTVWFDNQLLPGQDWKLELGNAIARCDAFVYALTKDSVASEWCEWEFATAVRLRKAVVPILLEADVVVPQPLQSLQYADFRQGATALATAKLIGALTSMQKIPVGQSPSIPPDPQGIPSRAWEHFRHWTDVIVTQTHEPQNDAEEIQGKFGANLFRGREAVGGRIIVTNQRLLFEAHKANLQPEPLDIPLRDISDIVPSRTLGIVPNGITVHCRSGQQYRFVVWGRKRIIALIERQRSLQNA
jgi:hypothetical protein